MSCADFSEIFLQTFSLVVIKMEKYPTPIETLNKLKGTDVIVELKNKDSVKVKLMGKNRHCSREIQ